MASPQDTAEADEPRAARRPARGELRGALLEAAFVHLGEAGLAGFSVAAIARRLGVSTAAPYRHFPDREHLLAALATQAAEELTGALRASVEAAGPDPVDRLAATIGAYVRFVAARGAGFDVIFAPELRPLQDAELARAGRGLIDFLAGLVHNAHPTGPQQALEVMERLIALGHGYVVMDDRGFLTGARLEGDVAGRATNAAAAMIRGGLATKPPVR